MRSRKLIVLALIFAFLVEWAVPSKYAHAQSDGIEINRPVYGTIDLIINRNALNSSLTDYTFVALKSYDKVEIYERAIEQIKKKSMNHSLFLLVNKLKPIGNSKNGDTAKSWYSHKLVQSGTVLLNEDKPRDFYYMLVFYDAEGSMLGYKHGELANDQVKLSTEPTVVALMYHHFTTDKTKTNSVTVHRDTFRTQLKALAAAGYVPIRQQDLLAFLKGNQRVKLPEKSVLITMDDGYESNFKLAYPILLQERFYASMFAVTSYRGKAPSAIPHFSWEQASEMYNSSFIDIESHTHNLHQYGLTHWGMRPVLSYQLLVNNKSESKFNYEKRIYTDLKTSKSLIEQHVANRVTALTYPYGSYNKAVISRASAAGYSLMYTTAPGVIRKDSDPTKLPRIHVDGRYTAKELLSQIDKELRKTAAK